MNYMNRKAATTATRFTTGCRRSRRSGKLRHTNKQTRTVAEKIIKEIILCRIADFV